MDLLNKYFILVTLYHFHIYLEFFLRRNLYRLCEIGVSISRFTLVIKLTTARVDTLHKNAALKSYSDLI